MSLNSKKILNVPNLRFKEFSSTPWKKRKIGDEMYIKSRIGWQALTRDEYLDNGDYYLVTGTDFTENNTIDFSKCYYVSKERYEMDDKIQLKAGDLIVTKDGTIGKVAYIESLDKPATLNSHLFVLRDQSGEISGKYLLYVLSSYVFKDFVNSIKTGSTLTGLPQKDMIKFEYGYPSIIEQNKIIDFLTLIDKRIETQNKIIEDLKLQRKAVNSSMINCSFNKSPFKDVANYCKKTNHKSSDGLSEGKYPFFTNEDETVKYFDSYDFDGEYIIANTGGKANFKYFNGKFAVMSDCLVIEIKDTKYTKFYYNILLETKKKIDYIGFEGSGLKHLNKEWLLKMMVPKASNSNKYLNVLDLIDEKIKNEVVRLIKLKEQKKYLLTNLFI